MKRLIYCLDGTANKYDDAYPTNVVIMDKSISENDNGIEQIKYYHKGVGTETGSKIIGGAGGFGLFKNIMDSYKHLCKYYELGDEIYIFGFSRGAFTARSFAGLIGFCGIISPENFSELDKVETFYKDRITQTDDEVEEFNQWRMKNSLLVCANTEDYNYRKEHFAGENNIPKILKIKYIGVWDTVKTIGVFKKYEWHDDKLSPHVEYARHAIALDERREKFNITKWDNIDELNKQLLEKSIEDRHYQQLWFPGTHGSVGGGGLHRGLSDEAFQWIREGAKKAGLKFIERGEAEIFSLKPNPLDYLYNSTGENTTFKAKVIGLFFKGLYTILGKIDREGPISLDELHETVKIRFLASKKYLPENKLYRPKSLNKLKDELLELKPIYDSVDYEVALQNRKNVSLDKNEDGMITIDNKEFYVYTVKKGDTLSSISKNITGSPSNFQEIQKSNQVSIPDANIIYIGQRVFIPKSLIR